MPVMSLPMYDIHHPSTVALTSALTMLRQRGVPADVEWHSDLPPHWRDDEETRERLRSLGYID